MALNNEPNNPDRMVYGLAKTSKGEDYDFCSHHALAITGSDKNNIYLSDPQDTSSKIIISRANFKKLNANLSCYTMQ